MPTRPNVLFITVDHWMSSLLGAAGHASILTPTLDQIARNGVRMSNAYSTCPICVPARLSIMTGTAPRTHGDRTFKIKEPMPEHLPTLADTFRGAGYQAYAVGKVHVHPMRDRIGFDDIVLAEEGRAQYGTMDDYELFLAEQGHVGQHYAHGMSNNDYTSRPWHLSEYCHSTNWHTREMVRTIKRRDPRRPALWYLSYNHPHPPLVPLRAYLDMYSDDDAEMPISAEWSSDFANLPYFLKTIQSNWNVYSEREIRAIRRAFYALCTHIDHQIRVVIGTLREEKLLDETIVLFTSDHGDMLGDHGLWAKRTFYEGSSHVPMIIMGAGNGETGYDPRVGHHRVDDRLVCLDDIMPTLLDLAGVPIPETVDGISMVGEETRDYVYGECVEDAGATRMVRDGRFKLIYYAVGNRVQLFDLANDREERFDLATSPDHTSVRDRLVETMVGEFYGSDVEWVKNGELVGWPDRNHSPSPRRGLAGQRGLHWPQPPLHESADPVGMPQ